MASNWILKSTNGVDVGAESGSNSWEDASNEMYRSGNENVVWDKRNFLNQDFSSAGITLFFFEDCSFNKMNFSSNTIENCQYKNCDFENNNFNSVTFKQTKIFDSKFTNCTFAGLGDFEFDSDDSHFKNIDFSFSTMGMNIIDRIYTNTVFEDCIFDLSNIQNTDFTDSQFVKCSFFGTTFDGSILKNTIFNDCIFDENSLFNNITDFSKIKFVVKNKLQTYDFLEKWKAANA